MTAEAALERGKKRVQRLAELGWSKEPEFGRGKEEVQRPH
jgi:hypothetical protein